MIEAIVTAIITGVVSLIGNLIVNSRNMAIIQTKIEMLEKAQNKHNEVIERTYKLEQEKAVVDEQIATIKENIEKLSNKLARSKLR